MQKSRFSSLASLIILTLMIAGASAVTAQAPAQGGAAGPGGAGGPGGGGRGGRGGRGGAGALFGDPAGFFQQLDANKDGSVTEAEFTAGITNIMGQRGQGGQGGQGGPGGQQGNFDPVANQLQNLHDRMAPTDDEWTVLQPLIRKVIEAQTAERGFSQGGRGGRGGRGGGGGAAFGGRGGRGGATAAPEVAALTTAADDANSSKDQLTSALKAFRDARTKALASVTAAQGDLQKVVSIKQEAILVTAGVLE